MTPQTKQRVSSDATQRNLNDASPTINGFTFQHECCLIALFMSQVVEFVTNRTLRKKLLTNIAKAMKKTPRLFAFLESFKPTSITIEGKEDFDITSKNGDIILVQTKHHKGTGKNESLSSSSELYKFTKKYLFKVPKKVTELHYIVGSKKKGFTSIQKKLNNKRYKSVFQYIQILIYMELINKGKKKKAKTEDEFGTNIDIRSSEETINEAYESKKQEIRKAVTKVLGKYRCDYPEGYLERFKLESGYSVEELKQIVVDVISASTLYDVPEKYHKDIAKYLFDKAFGFIIQRIAQGNRKIMIQEFHDFITTGLCEYRRKVEAEEENAKLKKKIVEKDEENARLKAQLKALKASKQ